MKTVRRPPYPKWNPGYFPCSSLTPPSAFLTPSIRVLRWIRAKWGRTYSVRIGLNSIDALAGQSGSNQLEWWPSRLPWVHGGKRPSGLASNDTRGEQNLLSDRLLYNRAAR